MKTRILALIMAILPAAATHVSAAEKITLKDVTSGRLAPKMVGGMTQLADGERYARLSDDRRQVVACSMKTGEQVDVLFNVDNTIGEQIDNFDGYVMSPDEKRMLIQTNTQPIYRHSFTAVYYIYNIATRKLEPLSDGGPQQMPVWSPDGKQVAFVRDNNIYLIKLLYDNAESQVTKDGKRGEVINGVPDWVNEEEFGFSRALTFNADASMICWLRYDEREVKTYDLQLYKGLDPSRMQYMDYPGFYSYKYPKAGQQNSTVTAWSFDIQSRQTRQLQLPQEADGYVPRIFATEDPDRVVLLTTNRHQDVLNVYAANPRSTVCQLLIREQAAKYVKEETIEGLCLTGNHILLPSERNGKMELYLYTREGQLVRRVTDGNTEVTDVYGYDEQTGDTYFQAVGSSPMNRRVCVAHKNGKTENLMAREGWNMARFSKTMKYFVGYWSDCNTPFETALYSNNGKRQKTLEDNAQLKSTLAAYGMPAKEFFQFTTSEGVSLNGVMFKPAGFDTSRRYPVVMWQYSGPGSQQVVNSWNIGSMGQGGLYDALFCQEDFIVVCVDGRGTGGRGSDFEKCTYLHIGELEARDQVEAALYLGKLPFVDESRIGIWGWSYGGFCTLMSMSEGRPVFAAGVAVAPPTDWRFYDSIYTERFMRTPKENPSGYDINPISRAPQLSGSLLMCHGLADDNVHPQNTFEYSDALVKADKDFAEVLYTNRNHSIRGGNGRHHLLRQIFSFFCRELK